MSGVGIDLNPGAEPSLVSLGDFHDIPFGEGAFDVVFTNSLDHAFDIAKVICEVQRVLKPDGLLIVEAAAGHLEGGHLDAWDCFYWPTRDALIRLLEEHGFQLLERTPFYFPWHGEQLCLTRE